MGLFVQSYQKKSRKTCKHCILVTQTKRTARTEIVGPGTNSSFSTFSEDSLCAYCRSSLLRVRLVDYAAGKEWELKFKGLGDKLRGWDAVFELNRSIGRRNLHPRLRRTCTWLGIPGNNPILANEALVPGSSTLKSPITRSESSWVPVLLSRPLQSCSASQQSVAITTEVLDLSDFDSLGCSPTRKTMCVL